MTSPNSLYKLTSMRPIFFVLILLLGILLGVWSIFIEPNTLEVKRYNIKSDKFRGLKIVFASDFHIAPKHHKRLHNIVTAINRQHPDIVILGGDFVKGHQQKSSMPISDIASELSRLKARYGVYAVLGNHDWMYGGEEVAAALTQAGITVLADNSVDIDYKGHSLCLSGVEDLITRRLNISKALKHCHSDTILITHSPDIFPDVPPRVLLTLAGHTHGGQVTLPLIGSPIVPSRYGQRYARGFIEEGGKQLIVSKGLGTSLLPLRFNTKPEIVSIIFE